MLTEVDYLDMNGSICWFCGCDLNIKELSEQSKFENIYFLNNDTIVFENFRESKNIRFIGSTFWSDPIGGEWQISDGVIYQIK